MELRNIVAINLKYYRFKANMTQEEFYSKANLNYKYLSKIENGKVNITVDFIDNIAKLLGIETNHLVIYNKNHVIDLKRIDSKK